MPRLIKEFELQVDIKIDFVGLGSFGMRLIGNVTGGQFAGNRLKGEVVGASADWSLIGPDGFVRPDVRLTFKTVDEALIYVQFFGLIKVTPGVRDILGVGGDTPTSVGAEYIFVHPRMETGDQRYSWVNQTMFIGEGRLLPGPRAEYEVYRVVKS